VGGGVRGDWMELAQDRDRIGTSEPTPHSDQRLHVQQ
jgi:hypothetical protein